MKLKQVKTQTGSMLLEALVALMIFSIGILALIGLQANAITNSMDGKLRSDAAYFANQIIGEMWADELAGTALETKYASVSSAAGTPPAGTPRYNAWLDEMAEVLPNVKDANCISQIEVGADNVVTVTVQWRLPRDEICREYQVTTQIWSNTHLD